MSVRCKRRKSPETRLKSRERSDLPDRYSSHLRRSRSASPSTSSTSSDNLKPGSECKLDDPRSPAGPVQGHPPPPLTPCPSPVRPFPTGFASHPQLFPHLPITFPGLHAWSAGLHHSGQFVHHASDKCGGGDGKDTAYLTRSPPPHPEGLSLVTSSAGSRLPPGVLPVPTTFFRSDTFGGPVPFRACGGALPYSHLGFQAFCK